MSALFSKKGGKKARDIDFRIMRKEERNTFFEFLQKLGWQHLDQFEFDQNWSQAKIRRTARDAAVQMDADLLIETEDDKFSSNPFNDYVYYVWRRTQDSMPLPQGFTVPPLPLMQQLIMYRMQMQQQAQMPQPGMQPPPERQQIPAGQPNPFITGGQPPQQQKPPQPGPQQQRPQQPGQQPPQPGPQQQRPQQPGQQPLQAGTQQPRPAPQPGAAPPQPQPAQPCPKCGTPMAPMADGSKVCQKCGAKA